MYPKAKNNKPAIKQIATRTNWMSAAFDSVAKSAARLSKKSASVLASATKLPMKPVWRIRLWDSEFSPGIQQIAISAGKSAQEQIPRRAR